MTHPCELEPASKDNGPNPAGSVATPATPEDRAADALEVGEQIRQLQAISELRAGGLLTDGELTYLKRRVLRSGFAPPPGAQPAPTAPPRLGGNPVSVASNGNGRPGPPPNRRAPKGTYVTTLKLSGMVPLACRAGANKRPLYVSWKKALAAAAADAVAKARPAGSERFSVRIELRQLATCTQGSDLDNFVKPIQDALAEQGVFGRAAPKGPMKGDERVDHLDVRRRRVASEAEAGVLAEVWTVHA